MSVVFSSRAARDFENQLEYLLELEPQYRRTSYDSGFSLS